MKAVLAIPVFALCVALRITAEEIPKAPQALAPDARYKADVLLVVAHPDDDTTIGGYLARLADQHKRVAVIYCSSGDGGGDQVGNEAGRTLGQMRILESRKALATLGIDNVWFLGGSDTPGQNVLWALDHWHHGAALDEVVRLVRLTRPEVILTWLPNSVAGENHSDHQAAGVLATEAFDLAGDRTKFSEQVSPARDRTGMMNYTEGLQTWQPQKIYYFTDAFDNFIPYWHDVNDLSPFRENFLDGRGPSYSTTDISPLKHKSYARLAAEELSFYLTQDAKLAQAALLKDDLKGFEFPVRFIFGKSVVGGSVTGDVFEGTSPDSAHFASVEGYHPAVNQGISVCLGDPWLFYAQFWKAHNLEHLAKLLPVPEVGMGFGGTLHVPIIIDNETPDAAEITLTPVLPKGWVDVSKYRRFAVVSGEYPLLMRVAAPEKGKPVWQELSWNAESGGRRVGSITLRVYLGKGSALPQ